MQSTGIFIDINAARSVENIKKAVAKYKSQQEYLLLKIAPNAVTTGASASATIRDAPREIENKVFDNLCIVASVRRNKYKLGSWIPAIVGSFTSKTVDLGNFESCGSLWRLIRLDDPWGGIRVIMECCEIGEPILYLTSSHELSENNTYAAEWSLTPFTSPDVSEQMCVQIRSTDDKKLLCCNAEEGLSLLTDDEVHNTDVFGEVMWNIAWELIPEDSPIGGGDLAFLEDEADAYMES